MGTELELKFVLGGDSAKALLDEVGPQLEQTVRDPQRPIAYARTVYFDTDDLALFRTSTGPLRRRLRIREYANAATLADAPTFTDYCYLELKETEDVHRNKVRFRATAEALRALLDHGVESAAWQRCVTVAPAFREFEDALRSGSLRPRVTTWYRRATYCAEGLRMTLDSGLSYCVPATPGEAFDPNLIVASAAHRVLEVKSAAALPPWLLAPLERHSQVRSFSKFRAGMLALECFGRQPARRGRTHEGSLVSNVG
jgi:hypothetical protein